MKSVNDKENIIAYIKMRAEDGTAREALGVLMEDDKDFVRIAFNAHNGVVKDEIAVPKNTIIELRVLNQEEVQKISSRSL